MILLPTISKYVGYFRAMPFALRCLYKVCVSGSLRQIYSLLLWICMSVLCCSATVFLIIVKSRRKCGNLLESYHLWIWKDISQGWCRTWKCRKGKQCHTQTWNYVTVSLLCDCIFSLLIYGKLVLQYLREVWGESSCWVWIWVCGHEGLT